MSKLPAHLQHLTDELPADQRADVEAAINSSPYLQQRMANVMRIGQLEHIRLTGPGAHEGGHYDDRENAIYLSADLFTPGAFRKSTEKLDAITSTLGHENGHALNARESDKTLYFVTAQITEEIRAAGPGGVVDLTGYFAMHQRSARRDEAAAEIEGWNALASRIEHTNGGTISRQEMLSRAQQSTNCVAGSAANPKLASGIVLDPDMQMSDTRLPKAGPINLEPVAVCHFDKSASSLGDQGKANYANYYGAYLMEQIGQDTAIWSNPPTIKLDMQQLGLTKAQLESTGLNLGGQDLHFFDISQGGYKPVVVRHSGSGVQHAPDIVIETTDVRSAPVMSMPGHDAHTLWLQAQSHLSRPDLVPSGMLTQDEKARLTAGVVAGALSYDNRFTSIDHIVPSTKRDPSTGQVSTLIPVQGALDDPAHRRAPVDIQRAIAHSIEQSSDISRNVLQTRQQEIAQELTQSQTMNQDGPAGPTMKIGGRTIGPSSGDGGGGEGGGGGSGGGG
jgi:hypothetical protein